MLYNFKPNYSLKLRLFHEPPWPAHKKRLHTVRKEDALLSFFLLSIFFVADSRAPVFEKLQKVHMNMKKKLPGKNEWSYCLNEANLDCDFVWSVDLYVDRGCVSKTAKEPKRSNDSTILDTVSNYLHTYVSVEALCTFNHYPSFMTLHVVCTYTFIEWHLVQKIIT